jgi:phosphopantothenate-cysteine ligase
LRISLIHFSSAAVADFFVPFSQLSHHKIQSESTKKSGGGGGHGHLELSLPNTPKLLRFVREQWAPEAFMVSFKLETDEEILLHKATKAIINYHVHAVVANILQTRYQQVMLVTPTLKSNPHSFSVNHSESEESTQTVETEVIKKQHHPHELESKLIERLAELHQQHIDSSQ